MGKVIDFFSGRQLKPMRVTGTDIEAKGVYVGKVPKYAADVIRDTAGKIERNTQQQEQLMKEFTTLYDDYIFLITGSLELLGVDLDTVDPHEQDLFIDDDGNAWLVTPEKAPE